MSIRQLSRRQTMLGLATILATTSGASLAASGRAATPNLLRIVRDPNCGCCVTWAELAVKAGFDIEVSETSDYGGMKRAANVPEALWSCHTARIGGYVIEGHVPFAAIRQLLDQRPDITGIAVPGMPEGSPGMGGGVDATARVTAWGGTAGAAHPFAFES